jgi:hypothetical protein
MFRFLILLFLLTHVAIFGTHAQVNKQLKAELDSIYRIDQFYREVMNSQPRKDSLAKVAKVADGQVIQLIVDRMLMIDSSNIKRIRQIIKQYGYPGKTLVGVPTNEAAWNVIQHSKDIDRYFPLIEQAGVRDELPFRLVAMMQDRQLMYRGEKQIYGTQLRCEGQECYVWPITAPAEVNQRRKKAGFDSTVEENAKRLGVEYTVRELPKKK